MRRPCWTCPPIARGPRYRTAQGASAPFALPPALSAALAELSLREGVTLFMTLLATFQVLLARYSGQTDIVVGTPIANRTRPEIEPLIGCFVNSLALRADLRGNPRFRDVLRQVRETTLGAYEQQDLPFEKLVEELRPERNLSYTPIFQVLFTLQPDAPRPPALPGLTVQLVEVDTGTVKADLQLALAQTAQGLTGLLGYSTELFDAPTIARLIGHYQRLLAGIVADPAGASAICPC